MNEKQKKAFTLIELLVVIAIIALLMAIIMPSLSKAKEVSRRVICSSNLKQLTTAALAYSQENDDQVVPAIDQNGDLWLASILEYCGDPEIKMCPSVKKEPTGFIDGSAGQGPLGGRWARIDPETGACYEYWQSQSIDETIHTSSYGMNGYAQYPQDHIWGSRELFFGKITEAMSFKIPLFAPDIWRSGYPGDSNAGFNAIPGAGAMGNHIERFVFIRHEDRNNITFLDGHVERVYLKEMGTLKWHRQWEPREFDIPWLRK